MGKAFEKQKKRTIEDQGEKQIKAIQDNEELLVNINNDNDYKNKLSAGNNSESLFNELGRLYILCINQQKSPKIYVIT